MQNHCDILLTGMTGQVGHALYPKLQPLGTVIAPSRQQLDLQKPEQIRELVRRLQPRIIVNPAAYTAVDKAESDSVSAYAINATAPQILAEEAAKLGALLVHYSTDYVFDGQQIGAYSEADVPNPVSLYGKSKLAGELAIQDQNCEYLILRTSWVYGAFGNNFLKTILRLASQHAELRIVADQWGAPTSSASIADATVEILQRWKPDLSGVYHLTNQGATSWHGFAQAILREYALLASKKNWPELKAHAGSIHAITTAEYPTAAQRPANSRMDLTKLQQVLGLTTSPWETALAEVMGSLD